MFGYIINISDEESKKMSKNKFKKIVKSKMEEVAKQYLLKLKNKHSKMKNITFNKMKCQSYLSDFRINASETKLLFQLRTRMFPVKENFKNKIKKQGQNLNCELCKTETDNQKTLTQMSYSSEFGPRSS